MGLKSFRSEESSRIGTSSNALSLARGVGGAVLGTMLATKGIDPEAALTSAAILAATDGEGLLISATSRFSRLQRMFRIIPSTLGRKLDPVMDKIYAMSIFIGASVGGEIPIAESAAILATEVSTAAATIHVTAKGAEPETSKAGTFGMVTRIGAIATNLAAQAAEHGLPHEILYGSGIGMTVASVGLGIISCKDVLSYGNRVPTEVPITPTPIE